MGMTIKRRKDVRQKRVLQHRIADIRGGVSVSVKDLGGDYLHEGTPLSAPVAGVCHVVKTATLYADLTATDTVIKVEKGHHFLVGDVVLTATDGKAVAITAVDKTNKDYDSLTVAAGLAAKKGECIAEAKEATTGTNSALRYAPLAIAGTGKPVNASDNLDTDAWVIAVTSGNTLPDCVATRLKGIINY